MANTVSKGIYAGTESNLFKIFSKKFTIDTYTANGVDISKFIDGNIVAIVGCEVGKPGYTACFDVENSKILIYNNGTEVSTLSEAIAVYLTLLVN